VNHEEIHTSVKPVDPEELARLLNAARHAETHVECRFRVRGTVVHAAAASRGGVWKTSANSRNAPSSVAAS